MISAPKRALETLLARLGSSPLGRRRLRDRVLVLAYHNVVPDDVTPVGDRSLHLSQSSFAQQLDLLGEWFDVVPLMALVESEPRDAARPRAVITFDDAYRGAVTVAIPELNRRGLPATMFVAPGLLNDHTFWWDALAGPAGGLDETFRNHALVDLRGEDGIVRAWAASRGLSVQELPALCRSASESELESAAGHPGVTFGSHTWTHPNIARLGIAEAEQELKRSREWIEQRFGRASVPWLTFPYGSFSRPVLAAAGATGYTGAFRIDGGWLRSPVGSRYDLPRFNVPSGLSLDGLAARVFGPLAYWILGL